MRSLVLTSFLCISVASSAQSIDNADKRKLAEDFLHCYAALIYWKEDFPPDDTNTLTALDLSIKDFGRAGANLYLVSGMPNELVQERVGLVLDKNYMGVQLFDRSEWTNTILFCGSLLQSAKEISEIIP